MTAQTGAIVTKESNEPTKWRCLTCRYVVESTTLPYRCPRCGASRVKFVEIKAGASDSDEPEE